MAVLGVISSYFAVAVATAICLVVASSGSIADKLFDFLPRALAMFVIVVVLLLIVVVSVGILIEFLFQFARSTIRSWQGLTIGHFYRIQAGYCRRYGHL